MTQVWSVKQNKYVDPGGGTTTSQTGGDSSDLRSILIMKALQNPKQASQISTILNMLPAPSTDDLKKQSAKQLALQNITQLEDQYFGNKLHKGNNPSGIFTTLFGGKVAPGSSYGQYINTVESMKPTFARAAGDVGNLSRAEQEAAAKNFPTARYSRTEAIKRFNEARKRFGLEERDYTTITGSAGGGSSYSQYGYK